MSAVAERPAIGWSPEWTATGAAARAIAAVILVPCAWCWGQRRILRPAGNGEGLIPVTTRQRDALLAMREAGGAIHRPYDHQWIVGGRMVRTVVMRHLLDIGLVVFDRHGPGWDPAVAHYVLTPEGVELLTVAACQ